VGAFGARSVDFAVPAPFPDSSPAPEPAAGVSFPAEESSFADDDLLADVRSFLAQPDPLK
jgi:hypothetical protein